MCPREQRPRPALPAWLRSTVKRILADPLARNSLYLMSTTMTTAIMGYASWIVVARLYPVEEVGRATSLVSSVTLLSYFSLVGLGSSLIRFLPGSGRRSEFVSSAMITVGAASALLAALFTVVAPWLSPEVSFVSRSWETVGLFMAVAICAALNLLTDAVFIACRNAGYNLIVNGFLMGVLKVALPCLLVAYGTFGIFAASGGATAAAAAVSMWAIHTRLRIRLRPRLALGLLRTNLRYSLGFYATSSLNLVPVLVLPLVVLDQLGPVAAAGYFIAFQIATILNAMAYAVGESLLAEGGHEDEGVTTLARRSSTIMAAVMTPAVLGVVILAEPVLSVFGSAYAVNAHAALMVLAVSAFAVAFNTWSSFLLKITGQLTAMISAEIVFALSTTLLVLLTASGGLTWVALSWGVGNLLGGSVAAAALVAGRRLRTEPSSALPGRTLM